jgi:hypothetical protein
MKSTSLRVSSRVFAAFPEIFTPNFQQYIRLDRHIHRTRVLYSNQERTIPMSSALNVVQIEASRRNAQQSTGPASEAGKKKSSLNTLRHSLTSRNPRRPHLRRRLSRAYFPGIRQSQHARAAPLPNPERRLKISGGPESQTHRRPPSRTRRRRRPAHRMAVCEFIHSPVLFASIICTQAVWAQAPTALTVQSATSSQVQLTPGREPPATTRSSAPP